MTKRTTIILLPFLTLAFSWLMVSMPASAAMLKFENNINRPGNDLGRIDNIPSARVCASRCRRHSSCVSFTWVRPGYQAQRGVCWLKRPVPRAYSNNCCVSGIVSRIAPRRATPSGPRCPCVNRRTGQRYRHMFGQSGCPDPDSGVADYASCR